MSTASPDERRSMADSITRQGVDKLYNEVQGLQSDLRTLSSKVSHLADEGLSRVQERVSETVYEAKEAVRRNPYSLVAIALGLGFLLVIVLRR